MFMPWNLLAALACIAGVAVDKPRGELLFQPGSLHNHGSCIVEMPDGHILACWYRGSGEAQADDFCLSTTRESR